MINKNVIILIKKGIKEKHTGNAGRPIKQITSLEPTRNITNSHTRRTKSDSERVRDRGNQRKTYVIRLNCHSRSFS